MPHSSSHSLAYVGGVGAPDLTFNSAMSEIPNSVSSVAAAAAAAAVVATENPGNCLVCVMLIELLVVVVVIVVWGPPLLP